MSHQAPFSTELVLVFLTSFPRGSLYPRTRGRLYLQDTRQKSSCICASKMGWLSSCLSAVHREMCGLVLAFGFTRGNEAEVTYPPSQRKGIKVWVGQRKGIKVWVETPFLFYIHVLKTCYQPQNILLLVLIS